ncbi:MAG: fructose,6-bisphosphatase [Fusobacteriaceae bacterium]|nr:fructose,6-bisphosphatase [Fusobacteriaceae bacterium]
MKRDIDYLRLLSTQYENIEKVSSEIINLRAILNLPKGTEHFLTDLHGEYKAFRHALKSASGVLKFKIDEIFISELMEKEKIELQGIIYYPEKKLKILKKKGELTEDWYKVILYRLIRVCKVVSSKYSRSKVRKALPENFRYIIEELLHLREEDLNKKDYYNEIIETIINIGQGENFIITMAHLIQRLVVDKLHIVGDIFDRGPYPHKILDLLSNHHNCDIQWGNHDILWMGAAMGNRALIATAIRVSLRYGNLKLLEEGYGFNMRPLANFAQEVYKEEKNDIFSPILLKDDIKEDEKLLIAKMHKAIAIIQFKLEEEIIKNRKEFKMENELYLSNINFDKYTVKVEGKEYELVDKYFPTIDKNSPEKLTDKEEEIISYFVDSFLSNEKLQRHLKFLINKGSVYLKYNNNLLFHGCIPLNEKGEFKSFKFKDKEYKGKELLDFFDCIVRKSYNFRNEKEDYRDYMWYLWRGKCSPLFGKEKMTTFLNYFVNDKEVSIEVKNPYYKLREKEEICKNILKDFEMNPEIAHIINGHTPVLEKRGETPVKANGKLFVIDGGFSQAYQSKTGIAGYTLVYNSYGLRIISHKPFISVKKVLDEGDDVVLANEIIERQERQKVKDTDIGKELQKKIDDLLDLLKAYNQGYIKEKL